MTEQEKIEYTMTLTGDPAVTPEIIVVYLSAAEDAILNRLFPFKREESAYIPRRYERSQCKLAARYYLRRGAEGEYVHNENGITRHYGSVDDADILSEILPFAEVR